MTPIQAIILFVIFGICLFGLGGYAAWIMRKDSKRDWESHWEALRDDDTGSVVYDQDQDDDSA